MQEIIKTLSGSRILDFWFIGGASILVWTILKIIEILKIADNPGIAVNLAQVGGAFALLTFIVNHPHFMASYKLAYTQDIKSQLKYFFQLYIVPITMIILFTLIYFKYNYAINLNIGDSPYLQFLNYNMLGPLLLSLLANLMYFTVGWHYTKQSFGVAMVYSRYKNIIISKTERLIIKYSMLSLWWITFLQSTKSINNLSFSGFQYKSLYFGETFYTITFVISVFLLLTLLVVLNDKIQQYGFNNTIIFMTPLIAMTVWFFPAFQNPLFYITIVPFFHSLQYLLFVYKVEKSKMEFKKNYISLTHLIVMSLIVAGTLTFQIIPMNLDSIFLTYNIFGFPFFLIMFILFINIHHYFIDNALWRHDNINTMIHLK